MKPIYLQTLKDGNIFNKILRWFLLLQSKEDKGNTLLLIVENVDVLYIDNIFSQSQLEDLKKMEYITLHGNTNVLVAFFENIVDWDIDTINDLRHPIAMLYPTKSNLTVITEMFNLIEKEQAPIKRQKEDVLIVVREKDSIENWIESWKAEDYSKIVGVL